MVSLVINFLNYRRTALSAVAMPGPGYSSTGEVWLTVTVINRGDRPTCVFGMWVTEWAHVRGLDIRVPLPLLRLIGDHRLPRWARSFLKVKTWVGGIWIDAPNQGKHMLHPGEVMELTVSSDVIRQKLTYHDAEATIERGFIVSVNHSLSSKSLLLAMPKFSATNDSSPAAS